MEKDTFMALGLLPEERVVCKAQIGTLSRIGVLPKAYSVITTKRFFVVRPFSGKRSIPYEKVASINLKKGVVSSRLIINMVKEKNTGAALSTVITFANNQNAIAAFGIINNQIIASKDKNYAARESHRKTLEGRRGTMGRAMARPPRPQVVSPAPTAGREIDAVAIGKVVAASAIETAAALTRMGVKYGRQGIAIATEEAQRAWPILNTAVNSAISSAKKMSELIPLFIARRQQKPPMLERVVYTDDSDVSYFTGGKAYGMQSGDVERSGDAVFMVEGGNSGTQHAQATVQVQKQNGTRSGMNPDRDLKIFRVRKMREKGEKHVPREKPSFFNIFND
ncbi:MAG: PH domain-containing protein [Candidatus Micrarchaeales archaeon]|nr:PH domain-containing protein [Candidatus Micrarchaeales archaeon]